MFVFFPFPSQKGSVECSPNSSLHWSHSLLQFFGQMAVASGKLPTILYICLPNGCCFIKVLWRVPRKVLYIYFPVSSWGQSCVNCWHVSPIQILSAKNDPSCCCCWGILWAYFLNIGFHGLDPVQNQVWNAVASGILWSLSLDMIQTSMKSCWCWSTHCLRSHTSLLAWLRWLVPWSSLSQHAFPGQCLVRCQTWVSDVF